ncbi:MAG: multiple sugar transport system permease protein [Candidatus Atribacteria bacterium]|nr:multiple sugar transport system permease protein [Candidatus Atribacteria bacterium]
MNPVHNLKGLKSILNVLLEWKSTPYIILCFISLFLLFPFFWTFVTSFKTMEEVYRWPPTIAPEKPSFSGYSFALLYTMLPVQLLNSLIYALLSSVIVTLLCTITIYGLIMFPYRGSKTVLSIFFATRIIPPQALWLPFVLIYSRVGLINTRIGVIVFEIALIYPLAVWMVRDFFESFPKELIEAGQIDGLSRLGALFRIVVPIAAPAISAIAIIAFLWVWGEFMFPFLILNSPALQPVTVSAYQFIGEEGIKWNALAATQTLILMPGILFFLFAQKNIVKGLAAGSVKQ